MRKAIFLLVLCLFIGIANSCENNNNVIVNPPPPNPNDSTNTGGNDSEKFVSSTDIYLKMSRKNLNEGFLKLDSAKAGQEWWSAGSDLKVLLECRDKITREFVNIPKTARLVVKSTSLLTNKVEAKAYTKAEFEILKKDFKNGETKRYHIYLADNCTVDKNGYLTGEGKKLSQDWTFHITM